MCQIVFVLMFWIECVVLEFLIFGIVMMVGNNYGQGGFVFLEIVVYGFVDDRCGVVIVQGIIDDLEGEVEIFVICRQGVCIGFIFWFGRQGVGFGSGFK